MKQGRVIYSSGGNYKVLIEGTVFNAKPRGLFRKDSIKILVGDIVDVTINENKDDLNTIEKLHDRKNEFKRPNISNIDYAIIVASLVEPELDTLLIDKFITIFQTNGIEPILIFTKYDLDKDINLDKVEEYKEAGYKTIVRHLEDETKLEEWIKGSFSVITGQTGVGKSTFLNSLKPNLDLETQEISKALGRGKHTTRHSEAFEIFRNTYLVDTPGFSSLELDEITVEDASKHFFNFEELSKGCKYNDCKHLNEPNCNVKGNISDDKYANYKKIVENIEEKKTIYN